jgi:glycosyltransferase involved in cell wall biosynthesis
MTVNLVAFENGVGNSRDIALLSAALAALGCRVTLTVPTRFARRRRRLALVRAFGETRRRLAVARRAEGARASFDLTVMLEHVWPEQLHTGARTVIVPNPEFFDRHDRSQLAVFDAVWTKTRATEALFRAAGSRCQPIGFDSEDRWLADVPREAAFFHLAGKSRMKGTERLLAAWARHPEWPPLTVLQSVPRSRPPAAANIHLETRYLSDAELRVLQNRHRFHLCTSETEGWGHYLAEAESVGAIVLATDAAPMNELVTAERGLLLRAAAAGRQHLATLWRFDEAALVAAVGEASAMTLAEQARRSRAARDWFLANKADFPRRLAAALAAL